MEKLTESLENYLRIIYEVQSLKDFARVKDITSRLNVKTASVADALKKLGDLGLVDHKKYGYIKLTKEGVYEALKVYQKHQSMLTFLSEVMFMEEEQVAEDLACGLEHHLDAELFSKFEELSEFFHENPSIKKAFRDYLAEKGPVKGKRLCEVPSESEVRVRKLGGVKEDKDKLISMGILPGMTLEVEENSLSNDLMRIRIRGFSMTMTCEDAQKVVVTIL